MSDQTSSDETFMRECLLLAAKGSGRVSPNPLVGAVIVERGRVTSRGYHQKFGGPHAEVECLRNGLRDPGRATMYVNLEPCAHVGKTPPCVDLLIQSGIRRVVVGMRDPNPLVAGRGIRALVRAGVDVRLGVLEDECRQLNRFFVKHITTGRPFTTLKIAQSVDGMIAQAPNRQTLLSGREALKMVHIWRAQYDAVLVGAGTIRSDNPRLTVRFASGRNPDVIVLDGGLRLHRGFRLFSPGLNGRRVFLYCSHSAARDRPRTVAKLTRAGVMVKPLPARDGNIALPKVLEASYEEGIGSILVEGGSMVFTGFVDAGLYDELALIVAPRVLGGGVRAFAPASDVHPHRPPRAFRRVNMIPLGRDLLIRYFND